MAHPAVFGAALRMEAANRAEAVRLDDAARQAELLTRQVFARVSALAFGAWMVLDGVLFIASGRERLSSPVFSYAADVVPYWPWPFALVISVAGLGIVYGGLVASPLIGGVAYMIASAWQFIYCLMIWKAIADPPLPPARLVAYPPISDHGALSATACLAGLMLIRLWWRYGRIKRLNHAA